MGASLLIFLNKTDVEGCMNEDEVREVSHTRPSGWSGWTLLMHLAPTFGHDQDS